VSGKRQRIVERQLSRYLKFISREESDSYKLQEVLAYAILFNLSEANLVSNSFEEKRFQEMKQIYTGLENIISLYKTKVDPMQDLYTGIQNIDWSSYPLDSNLNDPLIARIYAEHVNDHLKRLPQYLNQSGFRLVEEISGKGPYRGRRTAMVKDYGALERAFGLKVSQW